MGSGMSIEDSESRNRRNIPLLMAEGEEELKSVFMKVKEESEKVVPGKSHGQRSLVGCSPWGHWESGTTDQLHFHSSLPCIGDGRSQIM